LRAVSTDGETFFPLAVTQEQLADATGLTGVHVNRTLKTLRRDGLADFSNRSVRIPNWKALAAVGEFEPTYLQEDVRPEERLRIV
jgi:DNA-binding transcriptional regulator LsrR (DeoR family)